MWTYEQRGGRLVNPVGTVVAVGYSGAGAGKNNPTEENVKNEGPLPEGFYAIGEPYDTDTHGPYVLPLTPDAGNEMFGRGDFLIHGDSPDRPGQASQGCIILPRFIRRMIWNSGDARLRVVQELPVRA